MRKFWRAAEAAIRRVKKLRDGVHGVLDNSRIEISGCAGKSFGFCNRVGERSGGTFQFIAAICVCVCNRLQNARKSGAAHGVLRREICATEKWTTIGSEKSGER